MVSMAFNLIDPDLSRHVVELGDNKRLDMNRYLEEFYKHDPARVQIMERRPEKIVFLRDFVTPADLNEFKYYREFLHPTGVEHIADLFFRRNGKITASICIHRDATMPAFNENDLKQLLPARDFIEFSLNTVYRPKREGQLQEIATRYSLSRRELEVVIELIDGADNNTIAGRLFISLATVKTHLNHIFEKMEVSSRTKLLSVVLRDVIED